MKSSFTPRNAEILHFEFELWSEWSHKRLVMWEIVIVYVYS